MQKQEILKRINGIMRNNLPEECRVVVFGSTAGGKALETSDIDVGILCRDRIDWSLMTKILDEVEAIPTLRKIDVVDLNAVEENFRESALKNAKELNYEGNI